MQMLGQVSVHQALTAISVTLINLLSIPCTERDTDAC